MKRRLRGEGGGCSGVPRGKEGTGNHCLAAVQGLCVGLGSSCEIARAHSPLVCGQRIVPAKVAMGLGARRWGREGTGEKKSNYSGSRMPRCCLCGRLSRRTHLTGLRVWAGGWPWRNQGTLFLDLMRPTRFEPGMQVTVAYISSFGSRRVVLIRPGASVTGPMREISTPLFRVGQALTLADLGLAARGYDSVPTPPSVALTLVNRCSPCGDH